MWDSVAIAPAPRFLCDGPVLRRSRSLLVAAAALALLGACRGKTAPPPAAAAPAAKAPVEAEHAPLPRFPCVPFEDLRMHLPGTIAGYKTTRDEGSSGKYGEVSISEAERVFTGDEGREISVRIVDTTMADELGRAIRAAAQGAADQKKDAATAPIIGDETVGFVRYDQARQRAEANLLVADRFVVAVTSRGVDGTQEVRQVANQMDLTGLALLR